jgi:endogenous inhibitor of DNA gyrase (YacG/DUF329 family)
MWLETVQIPKDHEEKCPSCGGGVHRRIYGEMYAGSSVSDGIRVEIRGTPNSGFADPIYIDPFTQCFNGRLYRRHPKERYWKGGKGTLHTNVWKSAFGPIPKGCHIHHKDNDPANNCLHNLECMDASEHLSTTWHLNHGQKRKDQHFSPLAREKAAEWHGSEEGRLWHSRHAERTQSWTKWKREEKPCEFCGKKSEMLIRKDGHPQKFCSTRCKAAAYRKRIIAERNG